MNINFERLRLQMHFRQLYEALGALDAEVLIADAWSREMERHDTMQQQRRQAHSGKPDAHARHLIANDNM